MSQMNPETTREVLHDLSDLAADSNGPDRDLDARVWWATADHSQTDTVAARVVARDGISSFLTTLWPQWRGSGYGRDTPVPEFTSSVDAVLRLAETRLPDHVGYEIIRFDPTEGRPDSTTQASIGDAIRDGRTSPGALLAAVLTQIGDELPEPAAEPEVPAEEPTTDASA